MCTQVSWCHLLLQLEMTLYADKHSLNCHRYILHSFIAENISGGKMQQLVDMCACSHTRAHTCIHPQMLVHMNKASLNNTACMHAVLSPASTVPNGRHAGNCDMPAQTRSLVGVARPAEYKGITSRSITRSCIVYAGVSSESTTGTSPLLPLWLSPCNKHCCTMLTALYAE